MMRLQELAERRRTQNATPAEEVHEEEQEVGIVEYEFPRGSDLVGRGWEEPRITEAAAGCAGSAAAAVVFGASGAVAVFVAPEALPAWMYGMAVLAVGQVIAQSLAQCIRYRRGLQWWSPVRVGGKVRMRAHRGGGLEVWAAKGPMRAWVPASEFAVISVEGPVEDPGPERRR
mgnify:CR=1 FL=1